MRARAGRPPRIRDGSTAPRGTSAPPICSGYQDLVLRTGGPLLVRSGPPVYCHTSAVSFSPTAPCYAHKGRIYATRCRTQGLDSAVVCRAVFAYSRPCVRHRGGKGAKEGRGAEPRGKERLGFQGTAPAPRPHTFGYTPLGAPRWAARNAPEPRRAKVRGGAPAPASAIGTGGRRANGRRRTCQRQHSHLGGEGGGGAPRVVQNASGFRAFPGDSRVAVPKCV
ncbi:hypothetical protein HMPREF9005_1082 [Actinomyces sp. oral taxon 178 str. F0338]|nr:hypothetical protein HMPREF9005_1082 [Actinomyces sp. oral taxon 178 str. F0338]